MRASRPSLAGEWLIGAACGAFLLLFGLRQAVAALILVPDGQTIEALQKQESLQAAPLDRLISAERTALAVHRTPAEWSALSLALAERAGLDGGAPDGLGEARDAAENSLALAPASPYVWARLAVLDQASRQPVSRTVAAWRLAYLTGPNETRLRGLRVRLAVALWPDLSGEDRTAVFTDIHAAWTGGRDSAAEVMALAEDPFTANVIRAALVTDRTQLAAFDAQVKNRSGQKK